MGYGRFVDGRVIRERMARKDRRMAREQQAADTVTDYEMADAMQMFGGSFVQTLGELWHLADDVNRAKILAAWPDYCAEYRDVARLKRERAQRG